MIQVDVQAPSRAFKKESRSMKKTALGALRFLGERRKRVFIFLMTPSQMRSVNFKSRKQNRVTDVLSFSEPKDFFYPRREKRLGEIYLCPSCARERGETLEYLLVHGLLHLFGFEHYTKKGTARMERKEKEILAAISQKTANNRK